MQTSRSTSWNLCMPHNTPPSIVAPSLKHRETKAVEVAPEPVMSPISPRSCGSTPALGEDVLCQLPPEEDQALSIVLVGGGCGMWPHGSPGDPPQVFIEMPPIESHRSASFTSVGAGGETQCKPAEAHPGIPANPTIHHHPPDHHRSTTKRRWKSRKPCQWLHTLLPQHQKWLPRVSRSLQTLPWLHQNSRWQLPRS